MLTQANLDTITAVLRKEFGAGAEDALQDAVVTLRRRGFSAEKLSPGLVVETARNALRSHERDERRHQRLAPTCSLETLGEMAGRPDGHQLDTWDPWLRNRLARALRVLTPRARRLILLKLRGATMGELAGLLHLTPDALRARLYRARQRLARVLDAQDRGCS